MIMEQSLDSKVKFSKTHNVGNGGNEIILILLSTINKACSRFLLAIFLFCSISSSRDKSREV